MIIATKPKLTLRDILAIIALKIKSFPIRDRTTDKISKHDSVYSRFKIYTRAFNFAKLSKIRNFPLKNSSNFLKLVLQIKHLINTLEIFLKGRQILNQDEIPEVES